MTHGLIDEGTQKMMDRLADEARAFSREEGDNQGRIDYPSAFGWFRAAAGLEIARLRAKVAQLEDRHADM